jgi:hypothetical protein
MPSVAGGFRSCLRQSRYLTRVGGLDERDHLAIRPQRDRFSELSGACGNSPKLCWYRAMSRFAWRHRRSRQTAAHQHEMGETARGPDGRCIRGETARTCGAPRSIRINCACERPAGGRQPVWSPQHDREPVGMGVSTPSRETILKLSNPPSPPPVRLRYGPLSTA